MLDIKILGPGCMNCEKLAALCQTVINENNLEAKIDKIVDQNEFIEYGIMLTPALIVNGAVKVQGKIPSKSTLEHWLKEA